MATSGTSASQSSGESSSSSTPGLLNSPASDWELQLAQYLQQVGNQQMQWAQQEYARAGAVTDAQINNYISTAQQGSDAAGQTLGRYNSLYAPMTDQYAREAGQYASNGRIQNEEGRAESGVMQAGRQGEINAEQELQSFGADPSSGRYQDLIRASKTADAAAAAGAGETARRQVEAEGTRRKEVAMNAGMQLPGAAVNELNSAYQGIAGAENSALGLANTGVNLTTSPSKFYDPAMGVKYPPTGQTSQSKSTQGSTSASNGGAPSSSGSGSGGARPSTIDRFTNPGGPGGAISGSQGNAPLTSSAGSKNIPNHGQVQQMPEADGQDFSQYAPSDLPYGLEGNGGLPGTSVDPWDSAGAQQDPYSWGRGGQEDTSSGITAQNYGTQSSDPYQSTPSAPSDWGGTDQSYGDSTPAADWGSSGNAGYSFSDNYDYSGTNSDSGGDYSYAGGGGVIPSSMSPSGGAQTDDVPAHIPQTGGKAQLNVNEFVIPRDVAMWKGQEFFQKLIQQSRQARTGAPAKPSKGRP